MTKGLFPQGKKGLSTARLQVPAQFLKIVGKKEAWQATGTADYDNAVEFRIKWKRQKFAEWIALLAGKEPPNAKTRYEIAAELAHPRGFSYQPVSEFSVD
jgi:hypothetical protein